MSNNLNSVPNNHQYTLDFNFSTNKISNIQLLRDITKDAKNYQKLFNKQFEIAFSFYETILMPLLKSEAEKNKDSFKITQSLITQHNINPYILCLILKNEGFTLQPYHIFDEKTICSSQEYFEYPIKHFNWLIDLVNDPISPGQGPKCSYILISWKDESPTQ